MRRIFAIVGIISVLGGAYIALFTPTISILNEGYPASVWPAKGNFAEVINNNAEAFGLAPKRELTNKLVQVFDDSDGKAMFVLKDGKPVLTHFTEGYDLKTEFNSFSMVKSLIGILTLKAISDQRIASFNEPLKQVLAKQYPELDGSPIGDVTISQLLDMRSGIDFEVSVTGAETDTKARIASKAEFSPFSKLANLHTNGLGALFADLKVDAEKVGEFAYQNINTAILGLVLETIYDRPLSELLNEKIWRPAGAKGFRWRQYTKAETVSPYCCLYATVEDWARVGHFLLQNGRDRQFLSEPIRRHFLGTDSPFYDTRTVSYRSQIRYDILDRVGEGIQGYFKYFLGQGGQTVYLIPNENMVVVRFGDKHQLLHSTLYEIHRTLKNAETTQ
ncbi:MAG: serine hydrolase domain-containing protein [Hyphomicrobiales bacterium]